MPFLHGDQEVLDVLRRRGSAGSSPDARDDEHRVALVIGGGGMRGAYVAGMLRALDRAGLVPAFDEVYGASSGGFSGAAFLTGTAAACAASYPEDLCTDVFINMRRLGTRRPVVALDHLVHDVLGDRKPLAWHELGRTPAPLRVVATDAADLTAHTLEGMETVADWQRALRASASIPLLAGPPIEYGGQALGGRVGRRAARHGPGPARRRHARARAALPRHRRPAPGRRRRAVAVGAGAGPGRPRAGHAGPGLPPLRRRPAPGHRRRAPRPRPRSTWPPSARPARPASAGSASIMPASTRRCGSATSRRPRLWTRSPPDITA